MATALSNSFTLEAKKLAIQAQQLKDNTGAAVDMTELTNAHGTAGTVKAGSSGTAGKVDVFPATASKGKTEFTASDNSGNTTTAINTAAQAAARTYTIPDAGASANFIMSKGPATFSDMAIWPRATVAATGTNLATAAAVLTGFTSVTAADGTKGVTLPATPVAGSVVIIKNTAAAILKIWPDAAATINAIAANASLNIAASTSVMLFADSTTQWYSLPLLPS